MWLEGWSFSSKETDLSVFLSLCLFLSPPSSLPRFPFTPYQIHLVQGERKIGLWTLDLHSTISRGICDSPNTFRNVGNMELLSPFYRRQVRQERVNGLLATQQDCSKVRIRTQGFLNSTVLLLSLHPSFTFWAKCLLSFWWKAFLSLVFNHRSKTHPLAISWVELCFQSFTPNSTGW